MGTGAGDVERRVLYFRYCGEANTDVFLARVRAFPEHGHENWRGNLERYYRGRE